MTSTLDLSVGHEHRISVQVNGWKPEHKSAFAAEAQRIAGVTQVNSAGGATSFYVHFDPDVTSEPDLNTQLTEVAYTVGALGQPPSESGKIPPPHALTINGDPVILDGDYVTLSPTAPVNASDWTGIASVHERVIAFKQLAPLALAAVDGLIAELETTGHNGGPALDERQEAVDALRALHTALGELIAMVEKPGFTLADGEGLAASCAHYALRAAEKFRDDPVPVAVSALVLTMCTALGLPGVGGWLATIALLAQKRVK